jgi:mono/diheme cytochrome c family protein
MNFLVALTITLFLALCTTTSFPQQPDAQKTTKSSQIYAALEKAPAKARAKLNPFEKDPDAVAAGKNLFTEHCAECHGETAAGGKKGPSLRAAAVQNAAPGTLFWLLTNGVVRRGMPVWSKLPDQQRWQLVTYLKSLGISESSSAVLTPAAATSPSSPPR